MMQVECLHGRCVVLRAVLSAMSSGVACIGSNPNAQDERMYE